MSKSVTVNFEDGSSHVYDNVPDNVTDDQIQQRAQSDFQDQKIAKIDSTTAVAPPPGPSAAVQNAMENPIQSGVMAGLQTGYQLGNEFLQSPIGRASEVLGGGYGLKKAVIDPLADAIRSRVPAPVAPAPAPMPAPMPAPAPAPVAPAAQPRIIVPESTGGVPRPMTTAPGTPAQTFEALRAPAPTPAAPAVAAAEAQPASQISRAQSIVRSLALDKLLKGGVGMAAALTPGNAGQNYGAQFPQSGPYRGMEINPRTGRPWTPQELQQYR